MHHYLTLTSGQMVAFEHSLAAGRAHVVWTRISSEEVESGFYYIPEA